MYTLRRIIGLIGVIAALGYAYTYGRNRQRVTDAHDQISRDLYELTRSATTPRHRAGNHRRTDWVTLSLCAVILACVLALASSVLAWLGGH